MSLNRVVLVGRLTRDPELKYTPAGVAVAQLGIAVDRFTKNEQGEKEVDFFNIVAFRRSAEFAQNYLTKGRLVSVDGRLQTRSWVDQASGQKRTAFEIIADNLEGLDRKGDTGEGGAGGGNAEYVNAGYNGGGNAAGNGGGGYSGNNGGNAGGYGGNSGGGNAPAAAAPAPRPAAPARAAAPAGGGRSAAPAPADDDGDESDPFADE